jgi:hypothetical protein
VPDVSSHGVKSLSYVVAAACVWIVAPECAITRLPNSVGASYPEMLIGSSELLVTGRTYVPCAKLIGQHELLLE